MDRKLGVREGGWGEGPGEEELGPDLQARGWSGESQARRNMQTLGAGTLLDLEDDGTTSRSGHW